MFNSKICADWNQQPLINPITGRKIKINGPTYKKFETKCSSRRSPSPSRRSSSRRSPSPSRRSSSRRSPSPSRNQPEIYCGNNARDRKLLDGTKILGTRYQCLKKGIGKGLYEPILEYNPEYEPIEQIQLFCGNGNVLPQNKDRFGTRDECLRKGFAVGQKQKYDREGIQRSVVVSEDRGWYKIYLPSNMGQPFIRGGRR